MDLRRFIFTCSLFIVIFIKGNKGLKFQIVSTSESPQEDSSDKTAETCSALKENTNLLKEIKEENSRNHKLCDEQNKLHKNSLDEHKKQLEEIKQQIFSEIRKYGTCSKVTDEIERLKDELEKKLDGKLKAVTREILDKFDELLKDKSKNPSLPYLRSCLDVLKSGKTVDGVYAIQPNSFRGSFDVRCNMIINGGGWTYVLNRFDGSEDFYLLWDDYKRGFGSLDGEFWLGLEHLYQLTNSGDYALLVMLEDFDGKEVHASYQKFKIGAESEGYVLKTVEGYSGDAGDALSPLLDKKFSTRDKDQDKAYLNCAQYYSGAWWFDNCYKGASKLTGPYLISNSKDFNSGGTHWLTFHQGSLKRIVMMIRPTNS